EMDEAGVEIAGDEELRVAVAQARIDGGARLGHLVGIGAAPAGEPGRGALGRLVAAERDRAEAQRVEGFVEAALPRLELPPDLGGEIRRRGRAALGLARQQ